MFMAIYFTTSKTLNQPKYPSTDDWMDKKVARYMCIYPIYTYICSMNIYSAIKNEIVQFGEKQMNFKFIILSEIKTEEGKIISHLEY